MSISVKLDATAVDVTVTESDVHVVLTGGREVSAPLAWLPWLRDATVEQRANWRLIGHGEGIHRLDLDEDVSVASLLRSGRAELDEPVLQRSKPDLGPPGGDCCTLTQRGDLRAAEGAALFRPTSVIWGAVVMG